MGPADVAAAAAEAWAAGATEVCLQGGIHPAADLGSYVRLVEAARAGAPRVHVHAFSPLEVLTAAGGDLGAVPATLARLKAAGLGSLPGTAAEVLVRAVRARLCATKLSARAWLRVMRAAHEAGLRSTATIMFGATDGPADWASHLVAVRALQDRTGGFTEFVPLPFVPDLAPGYAAGRLRSGPTLREAVLMHAVSRLTLHGSIPNIQASWPKMGPALLPILLAAGANDCGGVLMRESITRAAGGGHGGACGVGAMRAAIAAAGRTPRQRTTLYTDAPPDRVAAAAAADGRLEVEAVRVAA